MDSMAEFIHWTEPTRPLMMSGPDTSMYQHRQHPQDVSNSTPLPLTNKQTLEFEMTDSESDEPVSQFLSDNNNLSNDGQKLKKKQRKIRVEIEQADSRILIGLHLCGICQRCYYTSELLNLHLARHMLIENNIVPGNETSRGVNVSKVLKVVMEIEPAPVVKIIRKGGAAISLNDLTEQPTDLSLKTIMTQNGVFSISSYHVENKTVEFLPIVDSKIVQEAANLIVPELREISSNVKYQYPCPFCNLRFTDMNLWSDHCSSHVTNASQ